MEKLAATSLPAADGNIRVTAPLTDDNTLLAEPDTKAIAALRSGTGRYPAGWVHVPYHWYRLDQEDGPLEPLDRIRYIGFVKTIDRIDPVRTGEGFEMGALRGEAHFFELSTQKYLGGISFAARSSETVRVTDGKTRDLEHNLTNNANWALHDAVADAVPGSQLSTPNHERDPDAIIRFDRRTRSGGASFTLLPSWKATRDPRLDVLVAAAEGTGETRRVLTIWREDRPFDYASEGRCKEIAGKRGKETSATQSRSEIVVLANTAVCFHSTISATSFDVWAIYPMDRASVFARCSGPASDRVGINACSSMLMSWQPEAERSTRVVKKGISIAVPAGWRDRPLGGAQIFSGSWTAGGMSAELMVRPSERPVADTDEACTQVGVEEGTSYNGSAVRSERVSGACIVLFHRGKRESMVALFASPSGSTVHAFCDVATVEELGACRDIYRSWRFE